MGLDGRPSAIRITLHSQVIGLALILVAVARDWGSIDSSNALSYVLVAGLAALLIGLLALSAHAPRRARGGRSRLTTLVAAPTISFVHPSMRKKRTHRTDNARILRNCAASRLWPNATPRATIMDELRPVVGPALPHVPAAALRRQLRDQPVDGRRRPGRSRARAAPVGRARRDPPCRGRADRAARRAARPARPRLHREPRHRRRRHVRPGAHAPCRAPRRDRPCRALVPRAWLRRSARSARASSRRAPATRCRSATTLVAGHRARSHGERLRRARAPRRRRRSCPSSSNDPRFYHVDIVFCPLDASTAMYAPAALDADSGAADRRARPGRDRADARRGRRVLCELGRRSAAPS